MTSIRAEPRDVDAYMRDVGLRARTAARALARAGSREKNLALESAAQAIRDSGESLRAANREDLERARERGLALALLDRLELTPARVAAMAEGLRQIAALPDPVGEVSELRQRPSGIRVGRMRVPLGVIGIVYESRPNVTADAAGLCLKAGNATILRGGSEAIRSNLAIARCIDQGLEQAGLPADAVHVVQTTDRSAVGALVRMEESVDVIVPRGGKSLIERISREATVPVIKHLDGVCHVYVDDRADLDKAGEIAFNAKAQRFGTCNTMETLLVARGGRGRVSAPPGGALSGGAGGAARLLRGPGASCRSAARRTRRTGAPNTSPPSCRCGWSAVWTRRWTISAGTDPDTPTPSSPKISRGRGAFSARSIRAR